MLSSIPRPRAAAALLATALAIPTEAQVPPAAAEAPGDGCVLPAVALAEDGPDTLLEIATEGVPRSLGARIEEDYGVVLDLAGCVPGPELSRLTFDDGLVSGVHLVQRTDGAGPVTAVAVETRQPVEYTVTSSELAVRLRLQPSVVEAPAAAEAREEPAAGTTGDAPPPSEPRLPDPVRLVRVLEPLPLPPPPESRAPDTSPAADLSPIAGLTESWARAWSDQRVDDYLSFYAAAFRPAEGSRSEWEARRRERVAAPSFVRVGLDGIEVRTEGDDRATASFWQSYASDVFSDLVYKTLTWTLENGAWKIVDERVVTPPAL